MIDLKICHLVYNAALKRYILRKEYIDSDSKKQTEVHSCGELSKLIDNI